MALVTPTIEKLNERNYSSWSIDIKFLLIERGLWKIVDQTETGPVDTSDKVAVSNFSDKCDRALSTIYLNVSQEYKRLIKTECDPVSAWAKLKKYFEPDDRVRHQLLYARFTDCRPVRGEPYALFFARVRELVDQLDMIKHPMDADRVIFHVLKQLPSSFLFLVQGIMAWPPEHFTLNRVEDAVISEEARQKQRKEEQEVAALHTVAPRGCRSGVKCFRCHQFGHVVARCPEGQGSNRGWSSQRANKGGRAPWRSQSRTPPRNRRNRNWSPSPGDQSSRRSGNKFSLYIQACLSETDSDAFVLDTAASHHFCRDRSYFSSFDETFRERVAVATSETSFIVEGRGDIILMFDGREVTLKNVLYSPALRKNLIAGNLIDKAGYKFVGKNSMINVFGTKNEFVFSAQLKDGIYCVYPEIVNYKPEVPNNQKKVRFEALVAEKQKVLLWHKRYGHISPGLICSTAKNNAVRGLPDMPDSTLDCEPCKLAKTKRRSFKGFDGVRSKRPLELLHLDLCGPIDPTSRDGKKYIFTIIDDFSRKVTVFPLEHKSEAFSSFKGFHVRAERFLNQKLVSIRSDNGGEFRNQNFFEYCEKLGIKHEFTNAYTPEQNGVAERFNLTIIDCVKAMIQESGLSRDFWAEGVLYFAYSWNRVCHANFRQTPFELYCGHKPSVKHLKQFGVLSYVGIPKVHRSKLDNRTKKGVMVGYALNTKGYRIWIPTENRIVETINVTFEEEKIQNFNSKGSDTNVNVSDVINGQQYVVNLDVQKKNSFFDGRPDVVEEIIIGSPPAAVDGCSSGEEPQIGSGQAVCDTPKSGHDNATWKREAVTRPDGSRTDIYYYYEGSTCRLRSLKEIEKFCQMRNLEFEKELFDFSGKNKFSGPVTSGIVGAGSASLAS